MFLRIQDSSAANTHETNPIHLKICHLQKYRFSLQDVRGVIFSGNFARKKAFLADTMI